jgi:Stealth protein CR2, conserved region 2/Stealth protein CR1, conserved region 1/Stealth protein CR4, conserved region 4
MTPPAPPLSPPSQPSNCTEPIDIVYLWVDGSDPAWRAKRQQAWDQLHPRSLDAVAVYGNVEGRFRDNDELRFSLRALTRFFPNHGHVYVLTDGQTPSWLRASSKLTIIDHTDLIPSSSLPTFDSGHIESYIHCIPGLSERFFYCNDDVFFGAPVDIDHWFCADGSGFYTGWSDEALVDAAPMQEGATALENACRLSNAWLARLPNYQPTYRTFSHAPRPMLKSVLLALETLVPELFAMVRSTVFREWNKPTIVSDFVLRWSLAHGKAQIRDYPHRYISTGDAELAAELTELATSMGGLDFFCLNDTLDDAPLSDPRLQRVANALAKLLPIPSQFEC